MNELTLVNNQLPVRFEDLSKFVLIGREKLTSVRAEIRAIDKLELAKDVRAQKMEEAQWLGGALLDAEARIGEMLKSVPERRGGTATGGSSHPLPEGITHKQSHFFRTLADNLDIVEQVKAEATENEDIPTRTEVLRRVKEKAKTEKRETKIENYRKVSDKYVDDDVKIYFEEFQKGCLQIPDSSVDAIITDPPYPAEFLPLWQDMFDVANRILKPSAFLVAYANHQNLDKIFQMQNPLKYYWIFKLDFTAKPIAMGRNLIATWKPVLVYQKEPFKKIDNTIEDCIKETKRFQYDERDMHADNWGQSLGKFEYIVEQFTEPGDLVVEPFAGTGTTLVACKNTKRRCIGYEINRAQYEGIIKGRIVEGR